jgi:hypothetical protein
MTQAFTHRNRITGEVLAQNIQVCPVCYKNFSSDRAWEKHWERKNPRGEQCLIPEEVGLIPIRNTYGSIIYRSK